MRAYLEMEQKLFPSFNVPFFRRVKEHFKAWQVRRRYNRLPILKNTGSYIEYISRDFRELRMIIPYDRRLHWQQKESVYKLYHATEPVFEIMLTHNLEPLYVVMHQGVKINYRRVFRKTLITTFTLTTPMLNYFIDKVERHQEYEFKFNVALTDECNRVLADVQYAIYIARRDFFNIKLSHQTLEEEIQNGKVHKF